MDFRSFNGYPLHLTLNHGIPVISWPAGHVQRGGARPSGRFVVHRRQNIFWSQRETTAWQVRQLSASQSKPVGKAKLFIFE